MAGNERHVRFSAVPMHLKGAAKIAACFGVSRDTVGSWVRAGAPICLVGRKYQASYFTLCSWLEQNFSAAKARGGNRNQAE